jgi:hypothetical protein
LFTVCLAFSRCRFPAVPAHGHASQLLIIDSCIILCVQWNTLPF